MESLLNPEPHLTSLFSPGASVAGRYTVQRKLGSGSFASVYLVLDSKSKINEDKKVLKRILVGELKGDETVSFAKEAQLLSSLEHPAIVHFYCSFVELDSFCIATEYCEGGDLDNRIRDRWGTGRLFSERQVMEWLIQILLGVQYLHERLILHRDLKTKNIFLKNGMIKIGDFGVSRILSGSLDYATTFTGTPHYMSPEIFTCSSYGTKSDIWSLGCVLYEMGALTQAFDNQSWVKLVHQIVQGSSPTLPDCFSSELNAILQRMLNKDPTKRPSATETLKTQFIEENVKSLAFQLEDLLDRDLGESCVSEESAQIAAALEQKVHLDSLRAAAQAQGLDPRERRRLRQDQHAERSKVQKAVDQLYQQNQKKVLKSRHSRKAQASDEGGELGSLDEVDQGSLQKNSEDWDSEGDSDFDELEETVIGSMLALSVEQSCTLHAYQNCLLGILQTSTTDEDQCDTLTEASQDVNMNKSIESKIKHLQQMCVEQLGDDVFQQVYSYLNSTPQQQGDPSDCKNDQIPEQLQTWVQDPQHCLMVQQLLFLKEQLREPSVLKQAGIGTLGTDW
ncbi:serine/threonine-protein kinase Nek11-like [Acipenser ruthenus]|uniref:serine/threonine-protein kinase Nek11-like n=1 Tax=Acipenser ruthenus TaxID=7906 RepID=UPI002740F4A5|nr:serine/threonine-protein kinase Nek11-like [Acipenser ruthenus]